MSEEAIVIVGAGPAGLMAAFRASHLGKDVILLEKNAQAGHKLLLSGKGRCNLTNACDLDSFIQRFLRSGQFLRDAFGVFFNRDLMEFFEKRGVELKIERQLRVFPVSNRSDTILKALIGSLNKNSVKIFFNSPIKEILVSNQKVSGVLLENRQVIKADKVILATGGLSYPATGSTGEGIKIAQKLGHRIVLPRQGLVPLETKQKYPGLLEGVVLKNIRLKFSDGRQKIISDMGELLFTDFGISGPLVLSLSGQIVDWLSEQKNVSVGIDLKPALSTEQLDARLLREFRLNSRKSIRNTLKELLPLRLVDVFIGLAKINPIKKSCQITQSERQNLVSLFKGLPLDISGPRPFREAMVTRGGVSLGDINPRTMESRIIKGLYFAGEIMDVDADTGGFNLQAAFSTGYLAGDSARGDTLSFG